MRIFPLLKEGRNDNLLDILALLAIQPQNRYAISKQLKIGYATAYDNVKFLHEKHFITLIAEGKRRKKTFDITIKGALASIFSKHHLAPNEDTFSSWKIKNWGENYRGLNPFSDLKSLEEVKRAVETMYIFGFTDLVNIDNTILKKFVTDPDEAIRFFQEGKLSITKIIEETGDYNMSLSSVPGTTCYIESEKKGIISMIINPDPPTSTRLLEIKKDNEDKLKIINKLVTSCLRLLSENIDEKQYFHYNIDYDSNRFIVTGVIPQEVKPLLQNQGQVIDFMRTKFDDIVNHLKNDQRFIDGNKNILTVYGISYNQGTKSLESMDNEKTIAEIKNILK